MPSPYSVITEDPQLASRYLKEGRIVAFPTGTSYGLAVDATQGYALQRLRTLKQRPENKAFTIFMSPSLWPTCLALTRQEEDFLHQYDNQPLTLLVKPKESLLHLSQDGLVGLRIIDHPVMEELSRAVDVPLTATSANHSGQSPCQSPTCIQTAFLGLLPDEQIDEKNPHGATQTTYDLSLAAILDGGILPTKQSTTIARLINDKIKIIRPGSFTLSSLQT